MAAVLVVTTGTALRIVGARADGLPASEASPAARPEDGGARVPASFAVARFENRTGSPGLDWLAAAAPFLLAEWLEQHVPLRPVHDQWVLPRGKAAPVDAAAVASLAAAAPAGAADWMWTGWLAGHRGDLELGIQLWSVRAGSAVLVDSAVRRAPQEQLFRMLGESASELVERAGVGRDAGMSRSGVGRGDDRDLARILAVPPTGDFYAFTLFGRGLAEIAGAGAAGQGRARGSETGHLRRAESHLARAVHVDPRLAEAQRVLGEVYLALGRRDEARGRIQAALRLEPGYVPALATRAALARGDGELRRAEDLYRALLAHRPWDAVRRYELGSLLWERGRVDAAYEELARVVAQQPEHVEARRILVRVHAQRGDQEALIADLEALQRLSAAGIDDRFGLAAAYAAAGREDEALHLYQALASEPAARAQALKLLGDAYQRQGDLVRAVASYRRAIQVAPDDPRSYFLLATLHLASGETAAAEEVFRRSLRFRSLAPIVHNNLGAIAHRRGRYHEAMWYLRRAVWMSPHSARYRYNHALAMAAAGDLTGALVEVRAGLRIDPEHAELHYLHGVIKLRQDALEEARTSFENALRSMPDHPDARHNLARIEAIQREEHPPPRP
jgi:tetratricopeptide (TPR) repeat protein